MILSNVNIGSGPSAGNGDPLRTAFTIINNNFQHITSNVNVLRNSVTSVAGRNGNVLLTINDIIGINVYATNASVDSKIAANIANVGGGGTTYSNTNVAAYLTTSGYATLVYVDGQIAAANAGSTLANTIQNNKILQANLGMKGYVDNVMYSNVNVAAYLITNNYATTGYVNGQISAVNSAVSLANTIQSGQIAAANLGIIGYINLGNTIQASAITSANLGIIGYINLGNTIQASAITSANLGMKGYVDNQVSNLVNGAPATLDTLNELATALGNDANLSVTLTTYIGNVNSNIATANTALKNYVDLANTIQSNQIAGLITANTIQSSQLTQANLGLKGYVDLANTIASNRNTNLESNVAFIQANITSLQANAVAQQTLLNSLAAVDLGALSTIVGYHSSQIGVLQANTTAQQSDIANLWANSASLAAQISVLGNTAQIESNIILLQSDVTSLQSNAATQHSSILTLQANASAQASAMYISNVSVANYVDKSNIGMKGYVDNINSTLAANIATLTSNAASQGANISSIQATLAGVVSITGGVGGNIIPTANVTYTLGNITHQWKDLFVSNNTIYIGGRALSISSTGNLTVNGNVVPTVDYVNATVSNAAVNLSPYALNANVTAANVGMKGYVDNTISTANVGIIGYIGLGNTIQSAQITSANLGMKGYVDNQITTIIGGAPGVLDTLGELANALGADANLSVTITSQIANVNANITTANVGMKGYVDNAVSTANIGIIGYIDQGNSIQSSAITAANVGMKGYVDNLTYSNVQVAVFTNLSTYAYNANVTAANVGMKGYVDNAVATSGYSNVQVATYLPTHTGNVAAGNVKVSTAYRFETGNVTITNESGQVSLTPDTALSGTAGVKIGGSGFILGPNGARNLTLNYGSVSGALGLQGNVTIGTVGSGNLFVLGNVIARDITAGNIIATGTSGVIGFNSGGFVQQITSNANGVASNTTSGNIQLMSIDLGAFATHTVAFSCNKLTTNDMLLVKHVSGGVTSVVVDAYVATDGLAVIWLRDITGNGTGAITPMLKYAIIRAPSA